MKIIADNKKAFYEFFIDDKFEAGIELFGWEVKSARDGSVNLADSYVTLKSEGADKVQAFLVGAHFSQYKFGNMTEQDPTRTRRLLLNRSEINKIHTAVKAKGQTCVATKIYFNDRGRVKLEIALARGKHTYDKKAALKERDIKRETDREQRDLPNRH